MVKQCRSRIVKAQVSAWYQIAHDLRNWRMPEDVNRWYLEDASSVAPIVQSRSGQGPRCVEV